MMNWILDIYDQTEHLFAISSITILIVSLYLVYILRFPKVMYDECYDAATRVIAVVIWYIILFSLFVLFPHVQLREKSEERRAVQVEQPLVK